QDKQTVDNMGPGGQVAIGWLRLISLIRAWSLQHMEDSFRALPSGAVMFLYGISRQISEPSSARAVTLRRVPISFILSCMPAWKCVILSRSIYRLYISSLVCCMTCNGKHLDHPGMCQRWGI
ncbi:hypothetical protein T310_6303, partial [Rasamsonia emersonii CBS 393.64]